MPRGLPFGTFLLRRTEVRLFSAREVALLRTFGDQAAIVLESTRLFNGTQQALERQTALSEVLRVISESPTDAAPVFDAIAERAARLCKAQMDLSFRFEGAPLHHLGVHGVSCDGDEAVRGLFPQRPDSVTLFGRVALASMSVFLTGASIDLEPGSQNSVRRLGARSVLGVPMLHDGKVIGGLGVARTEPGGFAPALVQLLETFAARAVIAVENVRLFNETHAALEQQTPSAEALRVTSASLAAANQHKSEFLANMSHELGTPLTAIISFSEVMLERMFGELNDKQEDYLKDIFSSGKHLLLLTNDILDLSKIEAGRMELDLEDFDITLALGNIMTLIR